MRRRLFLVLSLLTLTVFAAPAAAQPDRPHPVKLGIALCVTGDLASMGEMLRRGADLAVRELAGQPWAFEPVFEDTQGNTARALSAVKRFAEIERIRLVVGPARSNEVLAVAPYVEQKRIIVLAPAASADKIGEAGEYIFRNRESGSLHGSTMAEYLYASKIRRVAVLGANSANSISYVERFKTRFAELGGTLAHLCQYEEQQRDFRSDILKALAASPQAIYVSSATGTDGGMLVRQLRQLGFQGIITGSPAFETVEFLELAGDLPPSAFFSAPAFDPAAPHSRAFATSFSKAYGTQPDAFAANSYDAVQILHQAVVHCRGDDPSCVRDYLLALKDYPGVSALTSFDAFGNVTKPVTMLTVRGGKFVPYSPKP